MAFAFFDVDDTLITVKSMFSFQEYWYATTKGSARQRALFTAEMQRLRRDGASREEINRRYYGYLAGRTVDSVARAAEDWFRHVEATIPTLYHTAPLHRLATLRDQGIEPVFVSGSFPQLLAPLARRLGVGRLLASGLEVADGRFTGTLLRQTIGEGKAAAIRHFLTDTEIAAADCHAFGDDLSDLPMLKAVGHPVAVVGDPRLEVFARDRGWEVLRA